MTKLFRPYSLDQRLLLPPDLREWLPEGHLALFVSDVVEELADDVGEHGAGARDGDPKQGLFEPHR